MSYEAYLQTPEWQRLRGSRLAIDNYRCRLCDCVATQVHHRRYPAILGTETVDDLTSLCDRCHKNYHHPPTLEEAREQIRLMKRKGVDCPVCDQKVKTYKRKLNRAMAICLLELRRIAGLEYAHIHDLTKVSRAFTRNMHGGNFATMSYWGLIQERPKDQTSTGRTSGQWRLTENGLDFLEGGRVPKYVYTFNMLCEGQSEETISLSESLGSDFDYAELAAA